MKKGLSIALALVVGVGIGAFGSGNLQGSLTTNTYETRKEGSMIYAMPRIGEVFIGNPDTKVPWFDVFIEDNENVMIKDEDNVMITGFPTALEPSVVLGAAGVDSFISKLREVAYVPENVFDAERGMEIVLFDELNPDSLSKVHIVLFDKSGKEALASSYNGDFELDYDSNTLRLKSDRFDSGSYMLEIVGLQLGKSDVATVMNIPVEFK